MKYSIIYILTVVAINLSFSHIPNFYFGDSVWSVGSVIAGFVFIARDFAQREVGHVKVFGLMIVAGAISYLMADPFVAIASIVAFLVSEVIDWCAYTFTDGSFKKRVLISSLIGVPVDTAIFLSMIGSISLTGFVVMTASKFISLFVLWRVS